MNTIQSEWISFAEQCIPNDAPLIQLQETKRAFYAGSLATLLLVANTDDLTDEAAKLMMDNFCAELSQFQKDVKEGRA